MEENLTYQVLENAILIKRGYSEITLSKKEIEVIIVLNEMLLRREVEVSPINV